jgi:hypothetical protein
MKRPAVYPRVYKTDHNAELKSDILVENVKHKRKTRDNQARECERIGDHSAINGISSGDKGLPAIAGTKNVKRRNQELNGPSGALKSTP